MRLDKAIEDIAVRLPGRVGRVGSKAWDSARRVFDVAARQRTPLLAVRPRDRDEVAWVLAWAADAGLTVSPRSGGHAFDGFTVRDDTVLLDLRDLDQAAVMSGGRFAVMPAVTNIGIAETLGPRDRGVPVGDCPAVALGGLLSGGGFGYAGRLFGLTCDHLVEATVAHPDGTLVHATADENPDIFWACRGGGGTAGVVTDMVFETNPMDRITAISITWQWTEVRDALALYARCMRDAPHRLDLKLKIRTTGADRFIDTAVAAPEGCEAGVPLVHLDGQFIGSRKDAEPLLAPLLGHPGKVSATIGEQSFHAAEKALVPVSLLSDPAPATLRPVRVASDFVREPLDEDGADSIVRFIDDLQNAPDLHGGAILLEPSDGRIAELPADACAFPHRGTDLLLEYEMFYDVPMSAEIRARHDDLLRRVRTDFGNRLTGGRYVNYADLLDTPEHWWGPNLQRLTDISARVDPHGVVASRLNRRAQGA